MEKHWLDSLSRMRPPMLGRRSLLSMISTGIAGLMHAESVEISEAGKRARKRRRRKQKTRERICESVCDGSCAVCRESCETYCESGCPRCYHRPGAAPFCGTSSATTKCGFCSSDLDCPPEHPYCFTGATDPSSGTTARFSDCGDYPTGICADLAFCF